MESVKTLLVFVHVCSSVSSTLNGGRDGVLRELGLDVVQSESDLAVASVEFNFEDMVLFIQGWNG